MDELVEKVVGFLKGTVHQSIEQDTELLDSGLVDSFHAMDLVSFIEHDFEVQVRPTDLTSADFSNAVAIAKFVIGLQQRKQDPSAEASDD